MSADVTVPLLHWQAPAWVWLVVVAALLLISGAIALQMLEQMAYRAAYGNRIDDDDTRRRQALELLVDLSDQARPGELTVLFTNDDVWQIALMTMQDEADAIDRWLAAGCPGHATPHAIARL